MRLVVCDAQRDAFRQGFQQNRSRTPRGHHGVANVFHVSRAADRPYTPLNGTFRDEPAGGIEVGALHPVDNFIQGHAPRRHSVGVHLNLKLAKVPAHALHRGHAGHRQQPVADIELGQIAQGHEIALAGFIFQGELENFVQPACEA